MERKTVLLLVLAAAAAALVWQQRDPLKNVAVGLVALGKKKTTMRLVAAPGGKGMIV